MVVVLLIPCARIMLICQGFAIWINQIVWLNAKVVSNDSGVSSISAEEAAMASTGLFLGWAVGAPVISLLAGMVAG